MMKQKSTRVPSRHPFSVKIIPFSVGPYLIRTVLWVVVWLAFLLLFRSFLKVLYESKTVIFLLENIWLFGLVVILGFLIARIPGLLYRMYSKLYIYEDRVVLSYPSLHGKIRVELLFQDITYVFIGSVFPFPICSCTSKVYIVSYLGEEIELKDITLGEVVAGWVAEKSGLKALK